jgi:hypothetical protein
LSHNSTQPSQLTCGYFTILDSFESNNSPLNQSQLADSLDYDSSDCDCELFTSSLVSETSYILTLEQIKKEAKKQQKNKKKGFLQEISSEDEQPRIKEILVETKVDKRLAKNTIKKKKQPLPSCTQQNS